MEGANEIFDVRVLMDNEPLAEKLEGKTIAVDPGDQPLHVLREGPSDADAQSHAEGRREGSTSSRSNSARRRSARPRRISS